MNLDIQTMSTTIAVVLLGNSVLSIFAWKNARLERNVFGLWSLGQFLISVGMIFIALRGEISLFLSLIMGNIFLVGGQFAMQEGTALYSGRKGDCRKLCVAIMGVLLAGLVYEAYFDSSVNLRIMIYSAAASAMSLLSMSTLYKKDGAKNAPEKTFICLQGVHVSLLLFRSVTAMLQQEYASLFHSGSLQAWIVMGLLSYYSCQSLCFFWLIARRLSIEVQRQAITDPLTGLFNRRALDEALQNILLQEKSGNEEIGFLFIDVDHFKELNDRHGHQAGDAFLICLAAELKRNLRAEDLAFRYAGDELAVILHTCTKGNLLQTAERIRKKVEAQQIVWEGRVIKATISIGAAQATERSDCGKLVKRADAALYEAKAAGKNQVKISLLNGEKEE